MPATLTTSNTLSLHVLAGLSSEGAKGYFPAPPESGLQTVLRPSGPTEAGGMVETAELNTLNTSAIRYVLGHSPVIGILFAGRS